MPVPLGFGRIAPVQPALTDVLGPHEGQAGWSSRLPQSLKRPQFLPAAVSPQIEL